MSSADNLRDGGADITQPVLMFSGPGHPDTLWSDVKGKVSLSRQIAWERGIAATHAIEKVSGAAEVRTRSLELHFSWNFGRAEAEAQSGRQLRLYRNRPRYGLILPPGTGVEFRIEEKSAYKFVAIEFEPHYVLRVAELQHLSGVEIIEAWDYNHPLTWRLAQAICEECESDARRVSSTRRRRSRCSRFTSPKAFRMSRRLDFFAAAGLRLRFSIALATIWSSEWRRTSRFPRSLPSPTSRSRISPSRSGPRWAWPLTRGFVANASIGRRRCSWIQI
jgi:hypothetical protein